MSEHAMKVVERIFEHRIRQQIEIIIIMQRLTCHVSVIGMTNRRCGGHVDLRLAVSVTRSSAIAEGPHDASCQLKSCQLKSCQLPRNSAETTYTTSPDRINDMKLEI